MAATPTSEPTLESVIDAALDFSDIIQFSCSFEKLAFILKLLLK